MPIRNKIRSYKKRKTSKRKSKKRGGSLGTLELSNKKTGTYNTYILDDRAKKCFNNLNSQIGTYDYNGEIYKLYSMSENKIKEILEKCNITYDNNTTNRGVKKENTTTVTNYFLGSFKDDLSFQNRYLRYINKD